MFSVILTIHVLVSISLIGFVLIQHGKGAEAGASFGGGGGASGSVFGASGSGNFLTKTTGILATAFFITSLTLAGISGNKEKPKDLMEQVGVEQQKAVETSESDLPNTGSNVPAEVDDMPVVEKKIKEALKDEKASAESTSDIPE